MPTTPRTVLLTRDGFANGQGERWAQKMDFSADTYIVLDLPADVAQQVLSIRKHFDFFFETIPAEITLTGSSGVGPVSQGQDVQVFVETLERVAANTAPIETHFKGVRTFPNSGVYFLEPSDQTPFRALHRQLADSRLSFRPCQFPYFAHCTIKNDHKRTVQQPESILSLDWPKVDFTLLDLRVYSLKGVDCKLLYETKLRRKPNNPDARDGL